MVMKKSNNRVKIQASLDFRKKLIIIQGKILSNGKKVSLTDITDEIINTPAFKEVEKQILEKEEKVIRLRMDKKIW